MWSSHLAAAAHCELWRFFTKRFYQLLAIKGFMSLPELGFNMKLLRWCCESATVFYYVHALLNVLPMQILDFVRIFLEKALAIFGQSLSRRFSSTVRILASCSTLPMQYHPFSSPSTCWRFRSSLRLPEGWGLYEYLFICCTAGYAFAENPLKGPGRHQAKRFTEIRVFSHESALSDAFSAFVHPQARLNVLAWLVSMSCCRSVVMNQCGSVFLLGIWF